MSFLNGLASFIPIGAQRTIGGITVKVVLTENTTDTLTITKQPVQQGASITDHAYMEPTAFSATIYYSDNLTTDINQVYQQFQDLQTSRTPFDIVTPKRTYSSMLMTTLTLVTDKNSEKALSLTVACQQVVIVTVSAVVVPRSHQKNPGSNGATQNAGKKSALLSITQGVGAFFH